MDELANAKRRLDETLGDNFKIYLQMMRQWFTEQITKEEFDDRVRQSLAKEAITAHNGFLLALLNKCTHLANNKEESIGISASISKSDTNKSDTKSLAETKVKPMPVKPLKKKIKAYKKANFENRFERISVHENGFLPQIKLMDDCTKLSKVSYCQRESLLPDHFMSHLRVFVISWENGLDGVQDNAVKLCNAALRDFIKSILTAIFASRSSYRLRDNRFKYSIGAPPVNPYLKNSYPLLQMTDLSSTVTNPESGEHQPLMRPTIDDATNEAMYSMACAQNNKRTHFDDQPITLRHLLHMLKSNRNVIPSHTVRCNAVYKTVCKLAQLESN